MRKYFLILLLLVSAAGFSQTTPNIIYGKEVVIQTRDTSSAELTIKNSTRNVLGYFKNIGGGKGQYVIIPQTDITGLPDSLLARYTKSQADARFKSISYVPAWLEITDKPANFSTTHALSNDIQDSLLNKVTRDGSYANPSWITSLDYSKLTGTVPTWNQNTTGNAATVTNGVYTTGSYANPSWITELAWSKVSGAPAFITGINSSMVTTALGYTPENLANKGVANGYADLDASGKIPASRIDFGQTGQTFVVASQAAMLAVSGANVGALAIRTDQNKNYRLIAQPASTLANWQVLLSPDAPVQSVNGFTGNVNLLTTHISEGSNYWWTAARSRAAQSLTTSGSSGAATYDNTTGVLNIPTYTLSGLGGQPALSGTGFVKISGTTISYDNSTYLTTETDPTIYSWAKAASKPTYSWGEITGTVPTWNQNTTGNAATVTNGVYTTGSYANPSWITSLDYSKLTGTVPTWNQNTTGVADNARIILGYDERAIAPNSIGGYSMKFGLSTYNNNSSSTQYADFIHLNSYNDASAGMQNLIMFNKSYLGMRIYQGSWNSSSNYSAYADVLLSSNFNSFAMAGAGYSANQNLLTTSQPEFTALTIKGGASSAINFYGSYSGDPSHAGFSVKNRDGSVTFSHNANGGSTLLGGDVTIQGIANFNGQVNLNSSLFYAPTNYASGGFSRILGRNGTTGRIEGLSSGDIQAFLGNASNSSTGLLTSSDWNTFNNKQPQLSGTGFVKISDTSITYDNTAYYPSSNPNGYITSSSLSPYALLTGASFTGEITGTTGNFSGLFTLRPANEYLRSYPTTSGAAQIQTWYTSTGDRRGYIGYGTASNNTLNINNETGGQIRVTSGDNIFDANYVRFAGYGSGELVWHKSYSGDPSHPGLVITNRDGIGTFYHNSNGGATSTLGSMTASVFNGSGAGLTGVATGLSINGYSKSILTSDTRTISPNSHDSYRVTFGFTSFSNNNTAPWADYLHLRSYGDGSGGNDNLVLFRKDAIGMRIYQQSHGSSTAYSSYVDVWHTGNLTNLSQLTNGPGYITSSALSSYVDISSNQYEIAGEKTFLSNIATNGKMTAARILGSTASYTTTATISSTITTAFCSGSGYTLTLPSASGVTGQILTVISNSSLTGITLSGVEGGSFTLICNHSLVLVSNGTTWKIASSYQNSAACS